MQTVAATQLKNRLGAVLEQATLRPVAIERHGRIVGYVIPALRAKARGHDRTAQPEPKWSRRDEERIMLALAERLSPGMSTPSGFSRWLAGAPVQAERFLPMLRARIHESRKTSAAALDLP